MNVCSMVDKALADFVSPHTILTANYYGSRNLQFISEIMVLEVNVWPLIMRKKEWSLV